MGGAFASFGSIWWICPSLENGIKKGDGYKEKYSVLLLEKIDKEKAAGKPGRFWSSYDKMESPFLSVDQVCKIVDQNVDRT